MKYKVIYLAPRKKIYKEQTAVFYTIEDATLWERHVSALGAKIIDLQTELLRTDLVDMSVRDLCSLQKSGVFNDKSLFCQTRCYILPYYNCIEQPSNRR